MNSVENVIEYINNYGSGSKGTRAKCIRALWDIFWYVSDVRALYQHDYGLVIATSAAELGLLDISSVYCSDALSGLPYVHGHAEYCNLLYKYRNEVAQGTLNALQLIDEAYKMAFEFTTKAGVYVSPLFLISARYVVGLVPSVPQPGSFDERDVDL